MVLKVDFPAFVLQVPGRPYKPIIGNMFEALKEEAMTNTIKYVCVYVCAYLVTGFEHPVNHTGSPQDMRVCVRACVCVCV